MDCNYLYHVNAALGRLLLPQIVVLAGGSNDFHNTTISPDNHVINGAYDLQPVADWVDMYVNYVQQVGARPSTLP